MNVLPAIVCAVLLLALPPARAQLKVVATLPDYGAIAEAIGGRHVKVTSLARGTEDPHFIDARPSFIRLLNQADILIEGGAEMEIGWLPPLVENARNPRILPNAPGRVSLARAVKLLDVPAAPVDRSMGDVHPGGNPHFAHDPANGRLIARQLAEAFTGIDPVNAPAYSNALQAFTATLDVKLADWLKRMEPLRGTKVATYHKSFDYFADRFGLEIVGQIEPKPGLEPSATHISALIPKLKQAGVKLILVEPHRARRTAQQIATAIGAKVVVLPGMVGGHETIRDYFGLFDHGIAQILAALPAPKP